MKINFFIFVIGEVKKISNNLALKNIVPDIKYAAL